MGAELFHADGLTKLTLDFRNFANAPNRRRTSIHPVRFEPAIPAIKWLQTYALVRTATVFGTS